MSVIIEKEAKSVEQAIDKGLAQMGLQREDVEIEIVSLGSAGFLGIIGGKPAKVRLKVLPQPRIKRLVETILDKMDIPGMVSSFREEGSILVGTIDSFEGEKYLKANQGAAINAIEYLVNKIYRDSEYEFRLDIGGFREKQNDDLKSRALQLAAKVKESGQEHKMEPMPPHQRKIVHKTLENSPDVKTFAVGNADRRRVIIAPRLPGEKPGQRLLPRKPQSSGGPERSGRDKFRENRTNKPQGPKPVQISQAPARPEPIKNKPIQKPRDDFKARTKIPKLPRVQPQKKDDNKNTPAVPAIRETNTNQPFAPRARKTKSRR